jgi:hypothetical protein
MTSNSPLFYVVYLSQVLLISLYLPSRIMRRARELIETYPPSAYPKLYPEPLAATERKFRVFRYLNTAMLLLGLGLLAAAWLTDYRISARYGAYPTAVAHSVYSMLQLSPMVVLSLWGVGYLKRMKAAAARKIRTAELKPRRLFDFVSPALLGTAVAMYVGAIASVLYLDKPPGWLQSPVRPWVAHIAAMTIVNVFFAGMIAWMLYGRKQDPHQTHEDRARQIRLVAQGTLIVSILVSVLSASRNALHVFELWQYGPFVGSVYLQLIVILTARALLVRPDPRSFEVYKADPNPAAAKLDHALSR